MPHHRQLRLSRTFSLVTLGLAGVLSHAQDAPATVPAKPSSASQKQRRAADDAYLAGAKQLSRNNATAAEQSFARAVFLDPSRTEYALSLAVAKQHHVTALVQQAAKARLLGHLEEATRLFSEAQQLDPDNQIVKQHLDPAAIVGASPLTTASEELARLSGPVQLAPTAATHSFHNHADAQTVLRQVYTAFGIRPTFDPSLSSQTVRFDLDDADFATATRILLMMTNSFATPLDASSVLLAKDTQENRDRLIPLVEETIYLPGLSTEQINELSTLAKTVFDLKQVTVQAAGSRLVLRGNEAAVNLLNATFADMIDGGAEVMLDVHLYEVDRSRSRNIGAQLPSSVGVFSVAAQAQQLVNANQSILNQAIAAGILKLTGSPVNQLIQEVVFLIGSGAASAAQFTNFIGYFGNGLSLAGVYLGSGATFNLLLSSSEVRLLDSVQMRVGSNQPGVFRSGTRYPIVTSTYSSPGSSSLSSALAGVNINGRSASSLLSQFLNTSATTIPQVQYEDLGLTLKATPQALKSGQVRVHLDLKIESLGAGSINGIPVLNNRQLTSDVTIPIGQTALMASEVSTTEQRSITGLPGLSEIPGFQGTAKLVETDRGELLITITPHLARRRSSIVASRRLLANISTPEQ